MKTTSKLICVLAGLLFQTGVCNAQFFSGGTFNSPKGMGLGVDFSFRGDGDFSSANIWMDARDFFGEGGTEVGIKGSFIHNFSLFTTNGPENRLTVYAGPGVSLGYVYDIEKGRGVMGALCADVGVRVELSNPLIVSLGFSADLGLHASREQEGTVLSIYKEGLIHSYYPELRFMYNFSERPRDQRYKGGNRKVTFAFEWGLFSDVYGNYHYKYMSPNGVIDVTGESKGFYSNWFLDAGVGYDILNNLNVSIRGGLSLEKDVHECFPLTSRITGLTNEKSGRRWLAYAEAGPVFFEGLKTGMTAKTGGGLRLHMYKALKLDLLAGCRMMLMHPGFSDEHEGAIEPEGFMRADDKVNIAVTFGTAVNF